jgi:outer membrane lipoprotein-sorting protein
MYKLILTLIFLITSIALKAQPAGYTAVKDLVKFKEEFTAAAKKMETIKSDFVQEKNLSMLSEKIVSIGKFWLKKDNLLRMEYSKPYEYLMILNKNNIYIKDGNKESKVSTRSSKLFQQVNRITIDCMQGTVFINPDLATKVYESKSAYAIEIVPVSKGLKDFFKSINVTIDKTDHAVLSIEMNETSGDDTVIRFTNRVLNTALPDALFAVR